MPNRNERLTEDFQRDVRQFWDGFKQDSHTFLRRADGHRRHNGSSTKNLDSHELLLRISLLKTVQDSCPAG